MSADRDHLMNDATGLVERMEVEVTPDCWWVVGRRANGCISLFAGADFVLQFNTAGELRRGFQDDVRLKAEGGVLYWSGRPATSEQDPSCVATLRTRKRGSIQLVSQAMGAEELGDFSRRVEQTFNTLARALAALDRDALQARSESSDPQPVAGRMISDHPVEFVNALQRWAEERVSSPLMIAQKPNVS